MMSFTQMANIALSHLGAEYEIQDIDNDNSKEAITLRRYQTMALKTVLIDIAPPFATKEVELTLLGEDPNDEWGYNYTYPPDSIDFQRIQSGFRVDINATRIPYVVRYGDNSTEIYTDQEDAIGVYTTYVDDPNRMTMDFILAYTLKWAEFAATKVTGGDPYKLKEQMLALYERQKNKVKARLNNEQQSDIEPMTELERSRR